MLFFFFINRGICPRCFFFSLITKVQLLDQTILNLFRNVITITFQSIFSLKIYLILWLGLRCTPTTIYSSLIKSLMSDLEIGPLKYKFLSQVLLKLKISAFMLPSILHRLFFIVVCADYSLFLLLHYKSEVESEFCM